MSFGVSRSRRLDDPRNALFERSREREKPQATPPAPAPVSGGAATTSSSPTAQTSRDTRLMRSHDVGAGYMQHMASSRMDAQKKLSANNEIDSFRKTLTPELQAEYDRQLEELRKDPRIQFEYRDGAVRNAAEEDLALRGILASTFGNPGMLEDTLQEALGDDGRVAIYVYPTSFKLTDFREGAPTEVPGYATPDGGIAIAQDFFRDVVKQGDNPFVHEFAHLTVRSNDAEGYAGNFPADFPYARTVQSELESEHFQEFLIERFNGGNTPVDADGNPTTLHTGGEGWPTLVNLFKQFPQELKDSSPEIYRRMTAYYNYDPLTQGSGGVDRRTAY